MERLTFEGNFCEIARCKEVKCPYDTNRIQKQVWERLKAYEDTGLTPEEVKRSKLEIEAGCVKAIARTYGIDINRLRKFAEADRDGRVVVLPCKVGDILWITGSIRRLYSAKVRTFFIGHPSGVRWGDDDGGIQMIRTTECDVPMCDFGRSVFLTREEAEKAMAERKGMNE